MDKNLLNVEGLILVIPFEMIFRIIGDTFEKKKYVYIYIYFNIRIINRIDIKILYKKKFKSQREK